MQEGTMFLDPETDRMAVKFKDGTTSRGFHCGDTFQVFLHGTWQNARIEYGHSGQGWYLIHGNKNEVLNMPLVGLLVK